MKNSSFAKKALLLVLLFACAWPVQADSPTSAKGLMQAAELVYEVSSKTEEPSNKESETDLALFQAFVPQRVSVFWDEQQYAIQESKESLLLADFENKTFALHRKNGQQEKAICSNIDQAEGVVKDLLPALYKTELEEIKGESLVILGHKCQKYRILSSSFLRGQGFLWIADDVSFPSLRNDCQTESYRLLPPMPLNFPLEKGAALKAGIHDQGVIAVYQAVSLRALAPYEIGKSFGESVRKLAF